MIAVVQIGSNQYKVTVGTKITVDRLNAATGDVVTFPALLVADNKDVTLGKDAEKIMVSAKVLSQGQADKLHVHRYRGKSRYRKHMGYRHEITTLEISAIGGK